jgi:hypothetical protein
MALTKEQINVRVSKELASRARRCAAVRKTSINDWVAQAIEAKAAQDYEALKIKELESKLSEVAEEYLPGRVATVEEMLEMAHTFAAEDTHDGLRTRHKASTASKRRPAGRRSR